MINTVVKEVKFWANVVRHHRTPSSTAVPTIHITTENTNAAATNIENQSNTQNAVPTSPLQQNKYIVQRQMQVKNFIDSIPYLQEQCNHSVIPKRITKSTTGFHLLADDELLYIFTFVDCRTLLSLSRCASALYHVSHLSFLWRPWLELEVSIIENLSQKKRRRQNTSDDTQENADGNPDDAAQDPTNEVDAEKDADTSSALDNEKAIAKYYLFYKPSQEETMYIQYKHTLMQEESLLTATVIEGEEEEENAEAEQEENRKELDMVVASIKEHNPQTASPTLSGRLSLANASIPESSNNLLNTDNTISITIENINPVISNAQGSPTRGSLTMLANAETLPENQQIPATPNMLARDNALTEKSASMVREDPYLAYMLFRSHKLSNPFIRSRLLKTYVAHLKKRYLPITRHLNHGKFAGCLFLALFTALLPMNLDGYIAWPLLLIYAPLLGFAATMALLVAILWTPTLQWPLALYRWVVKDYVGWWTSWAYSLTVRGRLIQLMTGMLIPLTILSGIFVMIFPTIIFPWIPFTILGFGCLLWLYTATQIIYVDAKRWYPIILFLFGASMVLFCSALVSKMAIIDSLIKGGLKWSITCIPLYVALLMAAIYQFKLSADMNRATTRHCICLFWNLEWAVTLTLLVGGMVMVILRMDSVYQVPYTVCFIPFYVFNAFLLLYYYLKGFTKRVKQPVFKNPFTVLHGGVNNTSTMESFVI